MDASWCMRRSKDLRSGAPDKIRTCIQQVSLGVNPQYSIEAGAILYIKQPHVSALIRNRSGNFSVVRLMDFSIALGRDVEITVRPTRKEHCRVSIFLA